MTPLSMSSRRLRSTARAVLAAAAAAVALAGCSLFGETTIEAWFEPVVDGDTVTVSYMGSDCRSGAKADVEETAERVAITVSETVRARECNDMGVTYDVEVRLDEPLGDRELVDGACLPAQTERVLNCGRG